MSKVLEPLLYNTDEVSGIVVPDEEYFGELFFVNLDNSPCSGLEMLVCRI